MTHQFNPGVPVAVDVASIEAQLRSLWKSASDQEGEGAVIRACSCNLIVFADTSAEARRLLQVVDGVAEHHPNRSLVAWADEGMDMRAWISARCSVPISGGPQVCSEVILLAPGTQSGEAAANTLISLLVPDLPVYLYLPSFGSPSLELVTRLAPWSTTLIMDSRTRAGTSMPGRYLLEFMQFPPSAIPLRDLGWARLTPWRDLVAQFFDGPDRAELASEIAAVEIRAFNTLPGELPAAALLLAGWLSYGLGWTAGTGKQDEGSLTVSLGGHTGEVSLSMRAMLPEAGQTSSIQSVLMRKRCGHSFSVRLDRLSARLVAESSKDARRGRSVPHHDASESELLVAELTYEGNDVGYRNALRHAIQIAGSAMR